jgi:predicted DNA-binding transcriptional regulator AlpA
VLYNAKDMRNRHISGWLTIARVAQMLQVSDSWIKRRIRDDIIQIRRDPHDKRFLFPDTPEGMAALQELKSGIRNHLEVAPRANK